MREKRPHTQTSLGARLAKRARVRVEDEAIAREAEAAQIFAVQCNAGAGAPSGTAQHEEPPHCPRCGSRRKLTFENGKRCRERCPCPSNVKRRRIASKRPDVHEHYSLAAGSAMGIPAEGAETVTRDDAGGHILMATGNLSWCWRCGSYAESRIHSLGVDCSGSPGAGQSYRLNRLKRNRHPFTNLSFDCRAKRLRVV